MKKFKLIFILSIISSVLVSCSHFQEGERVIASEKIRGNETGNRQENTPIVTLVKHKYIGNGEVKIQLSLSNATGVKKVILNSIPKGDPTYPLLPQVILSKEKPVANLVIKTKLNPVYVNGNSVLFYDNNIALYNNDEIVQLESFRSQLHLEPLNENGTNLIEIKHTTIREEAGTVKSYKIKKLETKTFLNEMSFEVSASSLNGYKGVIFSNGEEFMSEDPQELANAINSKVIEYRITVHQKVKDFSICLPVGECLYTKRTPIKNSYNFSHNYNDLQESMKLIKKGDVESVLWIPIDYSTEIEKAEKSK